MRGRPVRRQSKLGMFLIMLAAAVVIAVCTARTISLRQRNQEMAVTERTLNQEVEAAEQKSKELQKKQAYMNSVKYIEDEAKNRLGLVNPDEIVIKPKESDD